MILIFTCIWKVDQFQLLIQCIIFGIMAKLRKIIDVNAIPGQLVETFNNVNNYRKDPNIFRRLDR